MTRFAALVIAVAIGTISPPATAASPTLNVSIQVFDTGLARESAGSREQEVFPRIRRFESLLLPFALRETLANSGNWGAVRIIPEPDEAAELLITGEILKSDGLTLELRLKAVDASGRVWLDQTFADTPPANHANDAADTGALAYRKIYDAVAAALHRTRETLDAAALQRVIDISTLRHAATLVPSAFDDYLARDPGGLVTLTRLPAESDPIFGRTRQIRDVEYIMTDAVDEKFQELHGEIARTYDFWRRYRRDYANYLIEEAAWQASDPADAAPGSFEAVERSYDNYRWARMAEQEQLKWAKAFENEVGPAVERIESRVAELDDWVDNNYAEWQRLLAAIFSLETGLDELP